MLAKAMYFSDQVAKAVNDIPRLKRKTIIKKGNAQLNIRCYARVCPTQSHKIPTPTPISPQKFQKKFPVSNPNKLPQRFPEFPFPDPSKVPHFP